MVGLHCEDWVPRRVIKQPVTRAVTETDKLLFTALTHGTQPLRLDEEFSKATPFGGRLVNSVFSIGLIVGLPVTKLSLGTTLANLGFQEEPLHHTGSGGRHVAF